MAQIPFEELEVEAPPTRTTPKSVLPVPSEEDEPIVTATKSSIPFEEIPFEEVSGAGSTPSGKDERTAGQVVLGQTGAIGSGLYNMVAGTLGTAWETGKAITRQGATGDPLTDVGAIVKQLPGGIYESLLKPPATLVRGIGGIAEAEGVIPAGTFENPTQQDFEMATESAAQLGAGLFGPAVASRLMKGPPNIVSRSMRTPAVARATQALAPYADIDWVDHAPVALREMKDSPIRITNVESALKASENRITWNNQAIQNLLKDQEKIVVPDTYRQRIIEQAVKEIPSETWDALDPAGRKELADQIAASVPEKLTIGDLNRKRIELNKTQAAYYKKNTSGQMTIDESMRAVNVAKGNAYRDAFYDALDAEGLGGGAAAREYNSRIGSLIHWRSALEKSRTKAAGQAMPPLLQSIHNRPLVGPVVRAAGSLIPEALIPKTGHAGARGLGAVKAALVPDKSIDLMIAEAVRDWPEAPAAVSMGLRPSLRPKTLAGAGRELPGVTSAATPDVSQPLFSGRQPLLGEVQSPIADIAGQVQARAYSEARRHVPTLEGDVVDLFPSAEGASEGALINARRFRSNFGPRSLGGQNPTADYFDQLNKRRIWEAAQRLGVEGGEIPPKPPVGTQGSLIRGMEPHAAPASTMGIGPTPEPPARFRPIALETYTMQDLRQMVDEFSQFINRYPNHPDIRALRQDMDAVRSELDRRAEAFRTPS